MGGCKIPKYSMFTGNRITRGKSTIMGKNGYAKTHIVDIPQENSHISGRKFYYIANFPVGNSTIENHSHNIFSWGGGGGEGATL